MDTQYKREHMDQSKLYSNIFLANLYLIMAFTLLSRYLKLRNELPIYIGSLGTKLANKEDLRDWIAI